MTLLPLAIGIGLVLGLLFSERFGLTAGGMVVPGYLALAVRDPIDVVLMIAAALATHFLVEGFAAWTILFGRRRAAVTILVGFVLGFWIPYGLIPYGLLSGSLAATSMRDEVEVIGFILPGLIALGMDRQGVVETLSTLTITAVMVRLILILLVGLEWST